MNEIINDETIKGDELKLQSFADKAKRSSGLSFWVGLLLAVIGIAVLIFLPLPGSCDDCEIKIFTIRSAGSAFLIEIAAIVCFLAGKSGLKQADKYRNEIIVLRDITIALNLLKDMSDTRIEEAAPSNTESKETAKKFQPSEKDKLRSMICQILLNHYSR